jgi:hypothetical protein
MMVSVSDSWPAMPPTGVQTDARQVALFPAMVLLVIVANPPEASIPPTSEVHVEATQEALFPETVLFVSINVSGMASKMAPPDARQNAAEVHETVFAKKVLPATVAVPVLYMPPPLAPQLPSEAEQDARFPETTLSVSVNVPLLKMPPPLSELPFSMVRPEMLTVALKETEKTRLVELPLTARTPAPGPVMVRLLSRRIWPLVRVMSGQEGLGAKVMVSPLIAASTSPRSEPSPETPLSLQLVTVRVAARAPCGAPTAAPAASRDNAAAHTPSDARPRIRTLCLLRMCPLPQLLPSRRSLPGGPDVMTT